MPGRQRRSRRRTRSASVSRPEWRPARLVRRRVPLAARTRPQTRTRNDSVIAAIAAVIRDAMASEMSNEGGDQRPEGPGP
jgi:hypothetical protein